MSQAHGRRYEHVLAGNLDDVTTDDVWVTTAGHSGNAAYDDCDIVVTKDPQLCTRADRPQVNIEVKNVTRGSVGNRISDAIAGSSSDETGIEEVERLVDNAPAWADAVLALSMSRRKLLVLDARHLLAYLGVLDEQHVPPTVETVLDAFEPTLTPSNNVSMVKPEAGSWPSATASRPDAVVLADKLGLPHNWEDDDDA